MDFKPTKQCPKVPDHGMASNYRKPCKQLDSDTVDTFLQTMVDQGAPLSGIPSTQYGRRIAVEAFLRYNAIRPLLQEHKPWIPSTPTQPR